MNPSNKATVITKGNKYAAFFLYNSKVVYFKH